MSENKLGVGIIGQMYEDRKTGKVGKLVETNEKFRTMMFEDADGKTFSISAGTFKSNWRKKKDVEPTTDSSDAESEHEVVQPDVTDKEMSGEESESSDNEEEFRTDANGFYTDEEEEEEKPKKKRGRKPSKKKESEVVEVTYTPEELAEINLYDSTVRTYSVTEDSVIVNDVPFVVLRTLADNTMLVKHRTELNYNCDWSSLDDRLIHGPALTLDDTLRLNTARVYNNVTINEVAEVVKEYVEWFCTDAIKVKKEEN